MLSSLFGRFFGSNPKPMDSNLETTPLDPVVYHDLDGTRVEASPSVPGFSSYVPDPQPVRHTRIFSEEEVAIALAFYLRANGVEVPEGKTFVWGLENRECHGEYKSHVTLVIDVDPK